ncbi:uncharacterized protein LOC115950337 [Quercus lobata]|uniref:uncharacterized protein LOC115950337 n=1 Tax=Quercus lobata TaxID=97700 RepID=UPI0012464702|nr:uncharacterized protein LOC115950337 [Quercus lobata]
MCRPFFQLLHKWKDFRWTKECIIDFEDLKQYLSNPPIPYRPEKEEVLYAYLVVTNYAISLVLARNKDRIQRSIYYISKSLQEVETRCLLLEKVVLVIVYATRKLPHYFHAHIIVVLTQFPLQALLRKSDYTSRIANWETRLGAYDVKYTPLTAVKGQILANFVAEFIKGTSEKEEAVMGILVMSAIAVPQWEVYTDGASNQKEAGIWIVLITPEKLIMEKSLRLGFLATNNEAKYKALLAGVAMVRQLGGEVFELYSNSRLVVGQVNGDFEARDERMQGYLAKVQNARAQFKGFVLKQIPRGQNSHANYLAIMATSLRSNLPQVIVVEDIDNSSLIKWGLDIMGPFPRAIGNQRWLLIGTNYFTKWAEAKPLVNIRDVDAKKFIWRNIVTRFGVPHTLISDNGLQFDSKIF